MNNMIYTIEVTITIHSGNKMHLLHCSDSTHKSVMTPLSLELLFFSSLACSRTFSDHSPLQEFLTALSFLNRKSFPSLEATVRKKYYIYSHSNDISDQRLSKKDIF